MLGIYFEQSENVAGHIGATASPHTQQPSRATTGCGENAAEVLKAAGIKIYKSNEGSAIENAAALERGELAELTHFHAGFHGIA